MGNLLPCRVWNLYRPPYVPGCWSNGRQHSDSHREPGGQLGIRQVECACQPDRVQHKLLGTISALVNADTAISVSGATCYADFIGIPGGSLDGNAETKDRYCGGALGFTTPGVPVSQAIISKVTPFSVHVHTDGTETGSATPYGVALSYQQLAC